jgi:competence protein ComEA
MERIRRFIRNWLGFSRTETNGFLIFLPILFLLIIATPLYRATLQPKGVSKQDEKYLDSLVRQWDLALKSQDTLSTQLFTFNPNTVSQDELAKLGFDKRLTTRIAGYRSKGGVFRVKADLMKMYGMDSSLYEHLYAYIDLPEVWNKKEKKQAIAVQYVAATSRTKVEKKKFDLNLADTMQLKKIYGIGNSLSLRIIKFRDALGGFVSQDQLKDVYGLDSAVVRRLSESTFIIENFQPAKININTADEKTLASHPYIKKNFAKAIIAFRFQHGNFNDTNDITKITAIPPHQAERIVPYLTVTD